jgi:transcriptional regulator with XRE-family HTH domain
MAKAIIGQEIKQIVKKRGMTVEELAKALNVSKPNIFDIYKRESIDTGLLERLCKVLQYNFFKSFYQRYQSDEDKETIAMYKEQVDFLKGIIKEKEEMYRILVKVIDKKK